MDVNSNITMNNKCLLFNHANPISAGLNLDSKGFKQLLDTQTLVDCTLACDGGKLSAHKIVLSACSSYLAKILVDHPVEHPIIILPELSIEDVRTLVHYMYTGELLKSNTLNSASLLRTAAILSVNSLNDLIIPQQQQHQQPNIADYLTRNNNNILEQLTQSHLFKLDGASSQQQRQLADAVLGASGLFLYPKSTAQVKSQEQPARQQQQQQQQVPVANQQAYYFGRSNLNPSKGGSLSSSSSSPSTDNSFQMISTPKGKTSSNTSSSSCSSSSSLSSSSNQANQTHMNDYQFNCPVCRNDFQTICSFEYHLQRVHNVTSFNCEICKKPFASLRYVLTDHMRRCHGARSEATNSTQQQQQQQQQLQQQQQPPPQL